MSCLEPRPTLSTARLLADRALQQTCGQECVDWAIAMLERGREGLDVALLAGMSPPFNHFEVADHRDRARRELGISDITDSAAVTACTAELLRLALAGGADMVSSLNVIKNFYLARDSQSDLRDFYLLYCAFSDLQKFEVQGYWPDATRENILPIIHSRADAFLQATGNA